MYASTVVVKSKRYFKEFILKSESLPKSSMQFLVLSAGFEPATYSLYGNIWKLLDQTS
jgi:2-hydroxy-3-keto-5-methylthiopentenyl-1-phosphate phosphatase